MDIAENPENLARPEKRGKPERSSRTPEGTADQPSVPLRRRARRDEGFTLVEILVATTMLVVIMSAMGPLFYGAMRLTGVTDQRSQATNLAVAATEQMRSLPYSEVGFHTTAPACDNNSETPVTLTSPGPLDALPATTVEGHTTFTIVRCVYWSASSMPGTDLAYKQTLVKVSWPGPGGTLAVSQTSALYPGESPASVPTTTLAVPQVNLPPTCTAATDAANPSSMIDVSWTPAVGTSPSYYLVYYTTYSPNGSIIAGSDPYTTSPAVYSTSTVLTVGPASTYYVQVSAVSPDGTMSAPSGTCSAKTPGPGGAGTTTTTAPGGGTTTTTVPTTSSYSAVASATAIALTLGAGTVNYTATAPATTATNDGTGSNGAVVTQPTLAIPGADSFVSITATTQIAEANQDGSSYACAGVLSSGDSLSGGSATAPCSVSGSGSGGVSLNIYGLPGVGAAINTLVAGLTLEINAATSWAAGNAGGSSLSGSASLSGATVTVTPLGGLLPAQTIALNLPATLASPTDLVQAITVAVGGNSTLSSLASPLQTALASVLTLTGDSRSTSGGVLTVSALHIGLLGTGGTGDLAVSSVGPNQVHPLTTTTTSTTSTTSTTTTTTVPTCSINSLVVTPSHGSNGGGVALTSLGTLADESSFQLSVNVNSGCSQVEVGYAPSGCQPGGSGCATSYALMTGTSGTFYGSAGTAATIWQVGTTTFTVFTGTNPVAYSPLTQQQVILCTEQGVSGQC